MLTRQLGDIAFLVVLVIVIAAFVLLVSGIPGGFCDSTGHLTCS